MNSDIHCFFFFIFSECDVQIDTLGRQKSQDTSTMTNSGSNSGQNHVGSQIGQDDVPSMKQEETSKSEGTQAGGTLQQNSAASNKTSTGTGTRHDDIHDMHHNIINNNTRRKTKSTEDMNVGECLHPEKSINVPKLSITHTHPIPDPTSLKRMLKPMPSAESPITSPEMGRRRYNYYNAGTMGGPPHMHQHPHGPHVMNNNSLSRQPSQSSRFSGSRSSHEIGRGGYPQQRGLYLELERERGCLEGSPPSDNVMFDNQCYATTPSSSNGNSDQDQPYGQRGGGGGGSLRHSHHHQVCSVLTHCYSI